MSQQLLELHKVAAKAQLLQTQYLAGKFTKEEYEAKLESLDDAIELDPKYADKLVHYREIIDAAKRVGKI